MPFGSSLHILCTVGTLTNLHFPSLLQHTVLDWHIRDSRHLRGAVALLKATPVKWSVRHRIVLDDELSGSEEADLLALLSFVKDYDTGIDLKLEHSWKQYKSADGILKELKDAK